MKSKTENFVTWEQVNNVISVSLIIIVTVGIFLFLCQGMAKGFNYGFLNILLIIIWTDIITVLVLICMIIEMKDIGLLKIKKVKRK